MPTEDNIARWTKSGQLQHSPDDKKGHLANLLQGQINNNQKENYSSFCYSPLMKHGAAFERCSISLISRIFRGNDYVEGSETPLALWYDTKFHFADHMEDYFFNLSLSLIDLLREIKPKKLHCIRMNDLGNIEINYE